MATLPPDPPDLTPEQLFLGNLETIERVATGASRRQHFKPEDVEEFTSSVKLKLIEDNYAVIRKFEGRSSFRKYVTVVILRLLQDYRNFLWGKWRPSAEAKRRGPLATWLDMLLDRDGFKLDEACEILRTNHHVEASRQELFDLAAKLPPHNPHRRKEGEEELGDLPAAGESPDARLILREDGERKMEALELLRDGLATLVPEDRLIAKMIGDGYKVVDIAKALHLDQKPLYPRKDKILGTLHTFLVEHGVRSDEIADLLDAPELEDDDDR